MKAAGDLWIIGCCHSLTTMFPPFYYNNTKLVAQWLNLSLLKWLLLLFFFLVIVYWCCYFIIIYSFCIFCSCNFLDCMHEEVLSQLILCYDIFRNRTAQGDPEILHLTRKRSVQTKPITFKKVQRLWILNIQCF